MKIKKIEIIESSSENIIASINTEEKLASLFNSFSNISLGKIFEINDSVYSVEDISLKLSENSSFEILIHAEFVMLVSEVPEN